MKTVLFTKLFRGRTLDEIAEAGNALGLDGIDLLVRSGHQVEPEKPAGIKDAVRLLRAAGLAVPLVTTDLTNPAHPSVEPLLNTCAEADVRLIRTGYWKYDPQLRYQACFDNARRHLDGLETLGRKTGVKLAIQIHGGTIHNSGQLLAALLEGHDPAYIGAYPDPGNQTVQDGREDWRLTFDLLQPWLCCVGVKNGGWFPTKTITDGQRLWQSDWMGIADGMVPWRDILAYLRASGYNGLLSFHSHYEVPLELALAQTRVDLQFVRRQLAI